MESCGWRVGQVMWKSGGEEEEEMEEKITGNGGGSVSNGWKKRCGRKKKGE